jgi:hypothetical protein
MQQRALFVLAAAAAAAARLSPRPIEANLDLMRQLEAAGQLRLELRAPPRAAADPWRSDAIKGVAYLPSSAGNAVAMWRDFDAALAARELGFAAAAGFTAVRVPLHWALHATDAAGFGAALDAFVAAAAALNLSTVLTVFDGLGDDPGGDAVGLVLSGAYKTRDYLQNPGFSQLGNATARPLLQAYVDFLAARFAADARVIGWDAYFRPNLCASDPTCPTYEFLEWALGALSGASPRGFVTTTIIPGGAACDAKNVPNVNRTLVAFENYNGNRGAVGGDTQGVQGCGSSLGGLPALLTGSVGRLEQPPSAVCEVLFECYGQAFLDIPSHPRIGYILPWLMISPSNSFTRDLPVPNQGLVFPNGTWFAAEELACVAAAVPPFPPPPPGPPPPGVNFTTADGLSVGLRNATRAVQVLGLVRDERWFANFSFVPPLWNYIPEKPHRDFAGCHHIGDATFRVQPAAETNASSWAFYSTAAGGDAPAQPLAHGAELYDLSNLTAAAASNSLDQRFPLGIHVLRSVGPAPGGRPGFRIGLNLSVPAYGAAVRVGGLGFSLISDSFFGGNNNTAIAAFGSFMDAHVGGAHGFATITRADGTAQLLVTTCGGDDPAVAQRSGMEAWRPILEDAVSPNEGMWEWSVHTTAWSSEWSRNAQAPELTFPDDSAHKAAWPSPRSPWPSWHLNETVFLPNPRPWNPPTEVVLQPGAPAVEYALCFSLPPPSGVGGGVGPRARDAGTAAAGRATVVGVPGYVVASDMAGAAFLYVLPGGAGVSVAGVSTDDPAVLAVGAPAPAPGAPAYTRIPVSGVVGARGRARLVVTFSDGTTAPVHYFVTAPLRALGALYGSFAASTSWLPRDFVDPFGRSASFMPWDREDRVHVLQDARPFVVGLSDDAGAGANLGMGAKLAAMPNAAELALLDLYVADTLLGTKPDTATPPFFSLQDPETWRIFMTVFYFDKSPLNATGYYTETAKCTIGPSWCAFNSPYWSLLSNT